MDITAKIVEKSIGFLSNVRNDKDVKTELDFFWNLSASHLTNLLEIEKKVFWLNVYNGLVQLELAAMKGESVDKSIFSKKMFSVAGHELSLDYIEHGIIRGNKWKFGLGFITRKYVSKETKKWQCKKLDARIHFQLNCGAASCPMIRILNLDNLEQELAQGESDYLLVESLVNVANKRILLSSLFLFYLKDFGGMRGVKKLVKKYFPDRNYKISFKKFDWTKAPKKFNVK